MKKNIVLLVVVVLFVTVTSALAGGNVNLLLGSKQLDEDYAPVDEQLEIGGEADFSINESPIHFTTGVLVSADSENVYYTDGYYNYYGNLTVATTEIYAGIKLIGDFDGPAHPYIGAGLAIISAAADLDGYSDDDAGIGPWVGFGMYFTVSEHLNLGLNLRYSKANVELYGGDFDAGGKHINFMIGYHW